MVTLIARRLLFSCFVIFGVSIITFAISHLAPGDPARMIAGPRASAEQISSIRQELGLDEPVFEQYVAYVSRLAEGDLGRSIVSGRPIADELVLRVPATLELMASALVISVVLGIFLGVLAAIHKDGVLDNSVRALSTAGSSTPSFWLAPLLLILFYGLLNWFPGSGRIDVEAPSTITGFLVLDSILAWDGVALVDALRHLALPVLTLVLLDVGAVAKLVRGQMIEVMREDYIRTARANGLTECTVIKKHALRNALIPLVTVLGLSVAQLLYGSVIIESLFGWPGIGSYLVGAIFNLDFAVVMGFTVLVTTAYVLVNLLVDILYMVLDPQVRAIT